MVQIVDLSDHGLESLKKSAIVYDDTYITRYALRTTDAPNTLYFNLFPLIDQSGLLEDVSYDTISVTNISNTVNDVYYIGDGSTRARIRMTVSSPEDWSLVRTLPGYRIQEDGDNRLTESGDKRIVEI